MPSANGLGLQGKTIHLQSDQSCEGKRNTRLSTTAQLKLFRDLLGGAYRQCRLVWHFHRSAVHAIAQVAMDVPVDLKWHRADASVAKCRVPAAGVG